MSFDETINGLTPRMAMDAAEGVVLKHQDRRTFRDMTADSAERHPLLNVMGDILIEGLADGDAYSAAAYKRGVRNGVLAVLSTFSEYGALESLATALAGDNADLVEHSQAGTDRS